MIKPLEMNKGVVSENQQGLSLPPTTTQLYLIAIRLQSDSHLIITQKWFTGTSWWFNFSFELPYADFSQFIHKVPSAAIHPNCVIRLSFDWTAGEYFSSTSAQEEGNEEEVGVRGCSAAVKHINGLNKLNKCNTPRGLRLLRPHFESN